SSVRLCSAAFGIVASFDGEMLRVVAHEHVGTEGSEGLTARYPMPPNRGQIAGRAILDRAVIHVADVKLDPEYVGAPGIDNPETLSVPMLRAGHRSERSQSAALRRCRLPTSRSSCSRRLPTKL